MAYLGQEGQRGSFGQTIGSALGTGLGSGLQALANMKLQQLQQQQGAQRWQQAVPGLPSGLAQLIAGSPEGVQKSLLDRLEGLQFGGGQPQGQVQQQPIAQQQPITLGPSSAERRHRETLSQKERMHIDKLAAPVFSDIQESGSAARRVVNTAQEVKNLLSTGKAITGAIARITPKELQTPEGQALISKINELVLLKAQLGKGVPSRMRLTLEELAKPAIWQKPQTINKLVNDIINDPEFLKDIYRDEAREKLLQEYPEIPKDFRKIIEKESKNLLKQRSLKSLEQALPAKDNEGKIARNPETGQRAQSIDGKWVPID